MDNKDITKRRNIGIDLLRIIAMLYVVILHSLYHGGLIENVVFKTPNYMVAWGLEIWSLCAVNIFALVSGYVGYREEYKPTCKRYIQLWLEVVFYSFVIALVIPLLFSEKISAASLLRSLMPVTKGAYWFFTAYTCVVLVSPIVFAGVKELSSQVCKRLLVVLIGMIPVWSMVSDPFKLHKGYSAGWLLIMFCMGAILKKTKLPERIKAPIAFTGILLMSTITFALQLLQEGESGLFDSKVTFSTYISPTIVIMAVCYLCLFEKLRINNRYLTNAIKTLAPGAFAVYLINDNNLFRKHFIEQRFQPLLTVNAMKALVIIVASSVLFVVVCLALDLLRRKLFMILKIEELTSSLEKKIIQLF